MGIVIVIGLLLFVALVAVATDWSWSRRRERLRHKADYPLVDRYPPPQASAMENWPWV